MNVIAVVQANLETTPIGTRSRLADELLGTPILRRTVERLKRAQNLREIYVLCPEAQRDRCAEIVHETGAIVRAFDAPPARWASLVRTARKWALDGWRGGIGGTTCFDEYTDCRVLEGLLQTVEADAVLSVSPAAVLIDPHLVDRMIEHNQKATELAELTFAQTPPGLTGILIRKRMIHDFADKGIPVGWTFSYQPDEPRKDMIFLPCCYEVPADLRYATGRCIADTDRSLSRMERLLGEHQDPDAVSVGRWLLRDEHRETEPLPREVEIELTTEDPYPSALLRPRGGFVPVRGPLSTDVVQRIVEDVTRFDDSLIVLGGFGDPLRHPQFVQILSLLAGGSASIDRPYGLAVRTSAVDLSDAFIEAMVVHGVDVLNVVLDAWSPELYGRMQSPDDPSAAKLDEVLHRLDRVAQISREHASSQPIVVPEMTKARENVQEIDAFHDGWLRRVGAVVIRGHSHYAGQVPDRSVINMAPKERLACWRIRSRCMVLADGRVTMCDQDVQGLHTVGRIAEQSLENLWKSKTLEDVRKAHRAGRFDVTRLCAACGDWHRP